MTGIRVFNSIMLRRATLEGCMAVATLIGSSMKVVVSRGCPLGGGVVTTSAVPCCG